MSQRGYWTTQRSSLVVSRSGDSDNLFESAHDIAARARNLLDEVRGSRAGKPRIEELSFRLAHYTSLTAVVSMLQSSDGGLRLSDSSTMNDPGEGRATLDGRTIGNLLDDRFGENSWLRRRYRGAHICCFVGFELGSDGVEPGDDLLFWRLYGNECRGLSITLAPHVSAELVNNNFVQEVVYTNDAPLRVDKRLILSLLEELEQLQTRAYDANAWEKLYPIVLPDCDALMAYRFLHKRADYSMEREYRAVQFVTEGEDEIENEQFAVRGYHVQSQRIRRYVQVPELSRESIFTSKSRITVGANVPESKGVKEKLTSLTSECLAVAPNVVSLRVSRKLYRPR